MADTSDGGERSGARSQREIEDPREVRERPSSLKLERDPDCWQRSAQPATTIKSKGDRPACRVRFKDDESWKDDVEEEVEEVYEKKQWSDIWFEFCQNTSIAGLRQMTQATPFTLRR